uniref:Inter-alpha-trypsin inhibitor heavy chain 3b n=1 Tax=Cyprinus carpio TaxID=7962 RepID=A0A8C1PED2_CYPCA
MTVLALLLSIDIYSFHINSTVTSRYATTIITSRVTNVLNQSQEVHFEVKIPKDAFISQFRMTIEGKLYDGVVKEKEEAQQIIKYYCISFYFSAVGRTLEDFKTSVTVATFSKVTFESTYQELLKHRLGKYELLINAQPMQPVADFKIDIHIHENPGISILEVKGGLSTKDLTNAVTTIRADKDTWVKFYPTCDQQTKCDDCCKNDLKGNLIIMYDVERQKQSGDVMVSNDYFVHYFAPTDIQHIPRNVVFITDESGSMSGKKIEQTRLAMLSILSDLAVNDHFGLITFSGTDINAAVLKAVDMINKYPQEGSASTLILLTDGDPTTEKIPENVKKAIGEKFPLYSLGFGFDVSFEFLKKLSKVVYHSSGPTVDLSSGRPEHENFIKRLWAFLTVKQLLEKMVFLKGLEKDNAKKDTLDLSLKYKFVTPLTSMLVSPRMRKCKLPTNPRRERSQKGIHPEVIRYVRSNKEKELKDIYLFIRIIFMIFSLVSIRTSFEKIKNSYQPQTFQSYAFICWKVVFFILLAYSRFIPTTIFLWPAIWQQPKDVGLMDILGEAGISYYEIPGSQTPTLKIKDKEVKTSWVMVKDYRLASAPVVGCWLVPFQAVTQQELSDLTITQLYNSAKQQQKRLSIIVLTFPIITYSLYVHC